MTRRLFQDSTMMQNTRQVAVRYVAIDTAGFQHFQVVQREKAAIGTHLSWWLATFPLHFVHHRYQQPIVVQFPADLLGHDQMIVAHRQRCGIAQSESPPIRQKAAVPIGAGKLAHPGLLQPLEPHRNVAQLCGKLLHGRARHLQTGSFMGIFAGALLLPAPNVLADLGAFRAQLLEAIGGAGRCAGRDARGINGYVPQLSQSQRARQLHHLGEDVVQRSPMPLAKLIQRPKIRLRPSRQIAKRQIFPNALLQPPRTGHPQCVGIQPHFQQQRRVIRWMSLIAIATFQFPQVQLLHRAMHEKTQMIFSQHRSHRWWQQISLLRVVLQKIGHPALLLSRQYTSSVKLSCHTDSLHSPAIPPLHFLLDNSCPIHATIHSPSLIPNFPSSFPFTTKKPPSTKSFAASSKPNSARKSFSSMTAPPTAPAKSSKKWFSCNPPANPSPPHKTPLTPSRCAICAFFFRNKIRARAPLSAAALPKSPATSSSYRMPTSNTIHAITESSSSLY